MAAFRRKGRNTYELEPTIRGIGHLGRLATGVRDRRLAEQMEAALHELAMTGWRDLVIEVRDGALTVAELWQAKLAGPKALEALRARKTDPLLADAVAQYRKRAREREKVGADLLVSLAEAVERERTGREPEPVRLSWLTVPMNLTALYDAALAGGARPNTVRRTLHRAVAEILTRRFGRGTMLSVLADATVPSERDERREWLLPGEIDRLLEAADAEFVRHVGLALTTGIDRGPMLELRVQHYDEGAAVLAVPDTKAPDRPRLLGLQGMPVLENARHWLDRMVAGKDATDPICDLTVSQIRKRWEAIREKIERPTLRWKDLRGTFATYALLGGMSPRDVQMVLGHSSPAMTIRYVRRLPAGQVEELKRYAKRMGLPKVRLTVERGAAG